jgi:glyoxylase-like metal-dependent hydrolase (beta-lactamase superfamily II)
MGSVSALRETTGAKTAIHTNDAGIIRTGKNPPLHPIKPLAKLLTHISGDSVKGFTPYEPEILIAGEMSLAEFGINGKIIETPGHTGGSISVRLEDGSMIVGDAMSGSMIGKGKAGLPMFAEDIEKTRDSIRMIINLSPATVYTGHGGPFRFDDIRGILQS